MKGEKSFLRRLWRASGSALRALIYKLMPGFPISWFEAWYGSVAAAIIWELGSYIFVKAIAQFDYGRVYGKAGAVIALLAWVYTSSLIMLYGAHFTAQLHQSGD
ncbi:MAG: ribonuclease [Acidobacteria bacterium]|jgi:membrane protein|nr:ribonuclease [Acidobacteriota bacterium]